MMFENETPRRAAGPNPLPPGRMTDRERLAELCAILAAGVLRMRAGGGEIPSDAGDFPLPNSADPSRHAAPRTRRTA